MKLRLMPIATSVVVSSAVLFGGWFIYDSLAMESPLDQTVQTVPGVERADIAVSGKEVKVKVKLSKDASLRELVAALRLDAASVLDGRELNVEVDAPPAQRLEDWWASALFDVAVAMETRKYSAIPERLNARAAGQDLAVRTEMDEQYVYVLLTDERTGDTKYVMLPRVPAQFEGWSAK